MKNYDKNKRLKKRLLLVALCFVALISSFLLVSLKEVKQYIDTEVEVYQYFNNRIDEALYLSDIEYEKGGNQSFTRYDQIRYDEVNGGGKITLRIEGNAFSFDKGIWAHANSRVTYNISEYRYKYFTAFIGLNTTSNRGDGVKFSIFTSEDGSNWETKFTEVKLPGKEATRVVIELENAKYIRLEADQLSNNASDHSVYADAKLVNNAESTSIFKTPEEYDEIIKSLYTNQADLTGEIELNLLKRQLVSNVGNFTINSFYNASEDNKALLDWLMSNPSALRYYILGGKPTGTYYNSLTQLSRLYRNYKEDFNNQEVTKYGTVLGDLYLRMAVSLSLTHSHRVGLWINNAANDYNQSDSVRRYAIYRYMHKNGLLKGVNGADLSGWFEDYTVEEMRYVMATSIDDEEILWLNAYTQERIDKYGGSYLTPHPYIAYVTPNDDNPVFYAEENKDYFNNLFSVVDPCNEGERIGLWDLEYTIPGGVDVPEYTIKIQSGNRVYKLWIVMRNKFGTGVVCGGISKTGTTIKGVHGIPAAVVGQPGHAAYIYYSKNSNGEGYWSLDNDVSGWTYSGSGAAGGAIPGSGRGLLGYSTGPYAKGDTGSYVALAQEVINHKDTYEQSQKLVYLASSYSDASKKEELYRKALSIQPLNLEAWYGLVQIYNNSSNKTEDDYFGLAKEIAENLKYYPLPMYQMTNLLQPKLTSIGSSYKFTLLQTRILKEASATPNGSTEVLQPSLTRLMANFLLGRMDTTIATFSFDGEDENEIVLSDRYEGNGVRWDYSLDGKKTWTEVSFTAEEEHKHKLTKEEIESITSENDIYIHIVGVNYDEENLYKIDINESAGLPSTLFANDLENKVIGAVDSMEWKYTETDEWTKYKNNQPDLSGDKSVIVRMGATGTYLASNSSVTYTFTEDVVNNKRKYISISHLTLENVSTEAVNQSGSALFAIDANYNTRWHSAWNGSDTERYITVKFDQPYNISAVEFVPAAGGNGKIYDGTIWGSLDGENWIVISQKKGLTYTNAATTVNQAMDNIKSFDADVPQRVQYVKIVADRTNGNWVTARAFNFYEDTTVKIAANFTFDGANAGLISLIDSEYKEDWKYSLDGGNTWNHATGNKHQLSKDEIKNITSENGIKIQLSGDDTEYSINIKESEALEINPYVNDLENRLLGLSDVSRLEWKYSDEEDWTSYSDEEPIVKGNRTLQVRLKATGVTLPSEPLEYQFTEENQTDKVKYIPIKHLSIYDYSSQSVDSKRPYYAPNAIDGNPNTEWHTDFRYSIANTEAYITIKLDNPRYVSGLDYLHMDSAKEPYGFMKNGKVYVSEDGENWKEAAVFQEVAQDDTLKHVEFSEPIYGQYVKLVIESHDNIFASASMINLYEDISQIASHVNIKYNITEKTNQSVTAELVSDKEINVINNNGNKTFTFDENGTFTFEYTDQTGEVKTAVAVVDWIDKVPPTGTINYSIRDVTNQDVVATLTTNEEVIITNNNGQNTYTFSENGTFTFEFKDKAGNVGTETAEVTWINKKAPTGTVRYNETNPTKENVVATIDLDNGVEVINNHGSKEYTFTENGSFTFEFVDNAGNRGTLTAVVNWIDRTPPKGAISYSTTELTNQNVRVTLIANEDITVTNNNGSKEYIFEQNGEFTFEFADKAGNMNSFTAKVDWIDKVAPTAEVKYSTKDLTNQNVTVTLGNESEEIVVTNNNGSKEYMFEQNGEFTFEFKDKAGNVGSVTAKVDWIDKEAPTAEAKYSTKDLTNQNVTVTLGNESEEIVVTNNNGSKEYVFEQNGEFTFEFVDKAGNVGSVTAKVDWIDKVAPTVEIKYSITDITNQDVIATLVNESEEIFITNNNGSKEYVFEQNGEFTFEFVDKAGNKGSAIAIVNNIRKQLPVGIITYSKTELTNEDVIATITFEEEDIIIKNKTHKFTENGTYTFEYSDKAGNKGAAIAKVDWIDKESPIGTIVYSKKSLTNQDIVATVQFNEENVTILSEGGNTHTFSENGEFLFKFQDAAGNIGRAKARVNWIDKEAPIGTIIYSKISITNPYVIATIKFNEKNITILNDGGNIHKFTSNGEFVFKFRDAAGNIGSAKAIVNWINQPNHSENTDTSNKPKDEENNNVFNPSDNNSNVIVDTPPTKEDDENSEETVSYALNGFKVILSKENNIKNMKLKTASFLLPEKFKDEISEHNECFELYFRNELEERLNPSVEKIIITLKSEYDSFRIFEIKDNTLEELDYQKLSANEVEIKVKNLGQYIISYEDKTMITEDQLNEENVKKESDSILIYVLLVSTILLIASGVVFYQKRK